MTLYSLLVFSHLLLFVLWLGADVGVFLLGQHLRKRRTYRLDQRIALLKLLVIVHMTPRSACRSRSAWSIRPAGGMRPPGWSAVRG